MTDSKAPERSARLKAGMQIVLVACGVVGACALVIWAWVLGLNILDTPRGWEFILVAVAAVWAWKQLIAFMASSRSQSKRGSGAG